MDDDTHEHVHVPSCSPYSLNSKHIKWKKKKEKQKSVRGNVAGGRISDWIKYFHFLFHFHQWENWKCERKRERRAPTPPPSKCIIYTVYIARNSAAKWKCETLTMATCWRMIQCTGALATTAKLYSRPSSASTSSPSSWLRFRRSGDYDASKVRFIKINCRQVVFCPWFAYI